VASWDLSGRLGVVSLHQIHAGSSDVPGLVHRPNLSCPVRNETRHHTPDVIPPWRPSNMINLRRRAAPPGRHLQQDGSQHRECRRHTKVIKFDILSRPAVLTSCSRSEYPCSAPAKLPPPPPHHPHHERTTPRSGIFQVGNCNSRLRMRLDISIHAD
jgi:hypothetical protein